MKTEQLVQFSPSALAFYPKNMIDDGSYSDLPADLIELTGDELSLYWKQTPPPGKNLGVISGRPAWVDLPPPTHDELIAAVESERQRLLSHADTVTADWRVELVLGDISEEDKVSLSAWMAYKREVKTVKAGEAIVPGFIWPAIPA
ncbi:tail fiber assembly protein [Salmonella enterica subsp. enterica]|nr:tail fiber assembly protein [Salmonella enterica subsp. enterica serovar Alachua]